MLLLEKIILVFHIIVCLALIIVVLLQSSKGGGLAGAFGGGGGSQTIFGGQETATFLGKATTYLAILFMILSLSLAFLTAKSRGGEEKSVMQESPGSGQEVIPRGQEVGDFLGSAELDTVPAAEGQE
jgi:preprotein translocase subunit SecG